MLSDKRDLGCVTGLLLAATVFLAAGAGAVAQSGAIDAPPSPEHKQHAVVDGRRIQPTEQDRVSHGLPDDRRTDTPVLNEIERQLESRSETKQSSSDAPVHSFAQPPGQQR